MPLWWAMAPKACSPANWDGAAGGAVGKLERRRRQSALLAFDALHHLTDVGVFGPVLQDVEALCVRAPLEDLNVYVACSPVLDPGHVGLIKINCLGADEGAAVVVNAVGPWQSFDLEDGAQGEDGPIGGGAAELAVFEIAAFGAGEAVLEAVGFHVAVGGGADFIILGVVDLGTAVVLVNLGTGQVGGGGATAKPGEKKGPEPTPTVDPKPTEPKPVGSMGLKNPFETRPNGG